ncbi:MAG: peptidase M28 [Acidobacteria bacterium]|nr:MAG: peptidase M28 [Acidobacteriota bacterium]
MPFWSVEAATLVLVAASSCAQTPSASSPAAAALSGEKAMEHVRAQVALGPRPPGSDALARARQYIVAQLRGWGYAVEDDTFEPVTPYGPKKMHDLIARREGRASDRGAIVLATHYDTKYFPSGNFVGANDPGSSTALALELARVLAGSRDGLDYWFVFFDGEEAFIEWSSFDSTYGSRHLARRWKQEGVTAKIRAFILLDMIGDRDLELNRESNSTRWLRDLVWSTAAEIGLSGILGSTEGAIEDDHVPFLDAGVACVDLIDLNYGPPGNSYHHRDTDTLDKVSAESMEKVGKLVLAVLPKLQKKFGK